MTTKFGQNFYGKATTETVNNVTYLYSYGTNVAHYNHNENKMTVNGWYSMTTAKHINAFLEYYGFDKCNKKELENYEAIK